jgi:hypothetical protein
MPTNGGKSVAENMFNLECPRGHRWYSKEPYSWVDRECGMPRKQENKKRGYCKKKLALIRSTHPRPAVKPKKKKRSNKVLKVRRY